MRFLLLWFGLTAFFGGLGGAVLGAFCAARWRQPETQAAAVAEPDVRNPEGDAPNQDQIEAVAEEWAVARQVPGFGRYAAGYLRDGLRDRRMRRWWWR